MSSKRRQYPSLYLAPWGRILLVSPGIDPRYLQILYLLNLLIFGGVYRDFGVEWIDVGVTCASSFLAQSLLIWFLKLGKDSYLSATISCLSILLLCRSNHWSGLAVAAFLAIASKWIFRWKGKHFFNPTNFGIVSLILFSDKIWVSPAQWGSNILLAFWIVALGLSVVFFSKRMDISLVFFFSYSLLLSHRVWHLGQPLLVLLNQLENGGLLIFTLFMISDPRSTPDHPFGRRLFAVSVALLAYWIRFSLYDPNALLLALFFLSPLTIILDTVWKYSRFQWRMHATQETDSPVPALSS